MPKITKLTQQKRHPDRYSVYVDGVFAFGLSGLDLSNSGLRAGDDITDVELADWQNVSEEAGIYNQAVRLISYRRRSRHELVEHFLRKDVDAELIDKVADRLEAVGLVDDKAFAAAWIADRQLLRPRSKRMLEVELMKKGISRDDIKSAIEGIDSDAEVEQLMELLQVKRRQSRYADPAKLMGFLARQGYNYADIKKALLRLGVEAELGDAE